MLKYIISAATSLVGILLGWFLRGISEKKLKKIKADKDRFLDIDRLISSEYIYDLLGDISIEKFPFKKLDPLTTYHKEKQDLPEMSFLDSKIEKSRQKFNLKITKFMEFSIGRFYYLNTDNLDIACLLPEQRDKNDERSILMVQQARKELISLLRDIRESYDSFKNITKKRLML